MALQKIVQASLIALSCLACTGTQHLKGVQENALVEPRKMDLVGRVFEYRGKAYKLSGVTTMDLDKDGSWDTYAQRFENRNHGSMIIKLTTNDRNWGWMIQYQREHSPDNIFLYDKDGDGSYESHVPLNTTITLPDYLFKR